MFNIIDNLLIIVHNIKQYASTSESAANFDTIR